MEGEGTSPFSEELCTGFYAKPDESSPKSLTLLV
jgi:hypothetical protein